MRGWGTALAALGGAVLLAYLCVFDPGKGGYPSCPFRFFTGLDCPGCGSQRCLHDLLHGRLAQAWADNAFLLLAVPLAVVHWAVLRGAGDRLASATRKGLWWCWVVAIIAWGILRNMG